MEKKFFVSYNARFIAAYKSLAACKRFIERKGLKNDGDNILEILDSNCNYYEL